MTSQHPRYGTATPPADRRLGARSLAPRLAPVPGSYLLALLLDAPTRIRAGRLGVFELPAGQYVYAGSALGPGGVRARVLRHARRRKRRHWHVDALTAAARLVGVWVAYGRERQEHAWASACHGLPGATLPIAGFGASDCRCRAHLLRLGDATPPERIDAALAARGARPFRLTA